MENTKKTKRNYGIERTLGDIIYNPNTESVFCNIKFGFFSKTVNLVKQQDGGFDLVVSKANSEELVKIGKTYPVANVEGITKGTLGLLKKYDKELQKEITDSSDALFISTHKLKETKAIGDTGLLKIGYLKGQIGIEISDDESNNEENTDNSKVPDIDDINEDEIPF